jgi:hypothetical protein
MPNRRDQGDFIGPPRNMFDVGQKVVSDIARQDDGESTALLDLDQTLNDRQVLTGFDDVGNLDPLTSSRSTDAREPDFEKTPGLHSPG